MDREGASAVPADMGGRQDIPAPAGHGRTVFLPQALLSGRQTHSGRAERKEDINCGTHKGLYKTRAHAVHRVYRSSSELLPCPAGRGISWVCRPPHAGAALLPDGSRGGAAARRGVRMAGA